VLSAAKPIVLPRLALLQFVAMTTQQFSLEQKPSLDSKKLGTLLQQMARMNGRLTRLYETVNGSTPDSIDVLPTACKELGLASEELQGAIEELQHQNQELLNLQAQLVAERDRYRKLFDAASDVYLVTNFEGVIQEANRAASSLLNVAQRFLSGKPIFSFVASAQRQLLRQQLLELQQLERSQVWEVPLQPRDSDKITVTATVAAMPDSQGKSSCFQWIIRPLPDRTQSTAYLQGHNGSQSSSPVYKYVKGEIIPCKLDAIWQVQQGLVKLNTFSENGEEVLIGIASPSLPFGPGLTSLQTYQATALSDEVELVSVAWREIATVPDLASSLLSSVSQRLQQAEKLLAVSGRRRVQDRLYHFLLLLKQEVGQPVSNGTRIQARLTHEDLANACCTTRVTVTRILGKLQQQGKITLDSKHHIIVHDDRL